MSARPARCRYPNCCDPIANYRHQLCRTHYNRAKDRRRNAHGTLAWSTIAANPEILNGQRLRIVPSTTHPLTDKDTPPAARSCLTCIHLQPVPPRYIMCTKRQWSGSNLLAIETTERGGMPSHLVGRARTCPHFAQKP